jgi:ABC-type branched-subunit amino acid transport system ATPase component
MTTLTREIVGVSLEARGIEVDYDGVAAVQGVDLKLSPGEIVGLIGPNGAGKSSLTNALAGDIRVKSGVIRIGDRDVTRMAAYKRARLGMSRTSQTARVFGAMTVFEGLVTSVRGNSGASLATTLRVGSARVSEAAAAEKAWNLLDHLGLQHIANNFGNELSGGQRRSIDLAMAVIREPSILLLDEPMVGVAPALVPALLNEVRTMAERGTGVLIVEHALDVVASLCHRVIVMAAGTVIADGTYEEITENEEVRRAYLS